MHNRKEPSGALNPGAPDNRKPLIQKSTQILPVNRSTYAVKRNRIPRKLKKHFKKMLPQLFSKGMDALNARMEKQIAYWESCK